MSQVAKVSVAAAFLLAAGAALSPVPARAAEPAGATLGASASSPSSWVGTAPGGTAPNAPLGLIGGEELCEEGLNCDTFLLTLAGTPADWAGRAARVKIEWLSPTTDYDMYIHKDSNAGPVVATSGRGATSPTEPLTNEDALIDPAVSGTGVFSVRVVYYAATAADQYKGSAVPEVKPETPPPPPPSAEAGPRFLNYPAPNGIGGNAGEPTLGINWKTGSVMFIAGLETLRVTFDDASSPARATWQDVTAPNTSLVTLDPLLFTDGDVGSARTNRTFASQLLGKLSLMSFTDDDGATWTTSQGSGINSGVDHQTIGGGPYAKNADGTLKGGALPRSTYPHAVYYASQDIGVAQVARSDDGGLTFGLAVPMYDITRCGGLHGHIKVARDGTVYVPNKNCDGGQGVVVSEDNGLTWSIRTVPGSASGDTDPSLGIATDGTVYLGFSDGDGHARAAVSRDRGLTWNHMQDVGAALGVQNSVFPAVAAGDPDRAAFFFLGSATPGANGRETDVTFPGVWYGYVATTYDGGQSWVTVNATPNDPVQRGVVCTNGTSCPGGTRNLLDFNDLTMDSRGRIVAAFADGCVSGDCIRGVDKNLDGRIDSRDNDGAEIATILRQSGGKPLLAAYDPPAAATPAPPALVASQNGDSVGLVWSTPDDGGSPITGYRVYRGVEGGAEVLLASVGADVHSYSDSAAGGENYYRVTATNANGEGASSPRVVPTIGESPCTGTGVTVLTDASGDSLDQSGQHDIRSLHIAEPYFTDGSQKLVFTLRMADLSGPLTPSTTWRVYFTGADAKGYFVDMRTDAIGTVSFRYGTYIHNADNTQGPSTTVGLADAGSGYDPGTGAITIVVANSKLGNPQAGDVISKIFVRIPVVAVVPDNANYASPSAGVAYTLVGNASCQARPEAPSALTATLGRGKGVVELTWVDRSDNEESFVIERSTSVSEGYAVLATVPANTSAFTDRTAFRKTTYYYRLRAVTASGATSSYSNVASVRTR